MGLVASPREVTYSGTCHQWFLKGERTSLTLPDLDVAVERLLALSTPLAAAAGTCIPRLTSTPCLLLSRAPPRFGLAARAFRHRL